MLNTNSIYYFIFILTKELSHMQRKKKKYNNANKITFFNFVSVHKFKQYNHPKLCTKTKKLTTKDL